MYTLKNKIKILLGSVLLFTSLFAASPTIQYNALTDKQLHAVMGIITNFILSDVPQQMTIISPTNVTVEENQTEAINIDIKNAIGTVSYSISGTDATYFNIDASTGHITFINAPDHESKQSYVFNVTATDSRGNTATATITLHIIPQIPTGVNISAVNGNTASYNAIAEFTVSLTREPTSDVLIPVSSSNESEGIPNVSTLTFTATNWNQPQTVVVKGRNTHVVDGVQDYKIILAAAQSTDAHYNGFDPDDVDMRGIFLELSAPTDSLNLISGLEATIGSNVSYTGNESLSFSLEEKPDGMTINLNTGLISWTPPESAEGHSFPVKVKVTDGILFTNVSFDVIVAETTSIQSEVNGNVLSVTEQGGLKGLTITLLDTSNNPADITLEKIDDNSTQIIPSFIRRITDFFMVKEEILGNIKVKLPLSQLPAGTDLHYVSLYSLVSVDGIEGKFWSPISTNTDISNREGNSTIEISLPKLQGIFFIGIEKPEVPNSDAIQKVVKSGALAKTLASNINCVPTTDNNGSQDFMLQNCSVSGSNTINVRVENFGRTINATRWHGTTITELIAWIVDAQDGFDDLNLSYDNNFTVRVHQMRAANTFGYVTASDNRTTLHLTRLDKNKTAMQGTSVHEYFHQAQARSKINGKDLLINQGSERGWFIEGTARWFEDYLLTYKNELEYDNLNTYVFKEGGIGNPILEAGLGGIRSRGGYQRFSFFKLLNSKCNNFNDIFKDLLNIDKADDPSGVINLKNKLADAACNFGNHLGADKKSSLEAALLYYQYATLYKNQGSASDTSGGDISLLDSNERSADFKFLKTSYGFSRSWLNNMDDWLNLADNVEYKLQAKNSIPPAGALSFYIKPVSGNLPEDKIAVLNFEANKDFIISIVSPNEDFTNGSNTIGPNNDKHKWFKYSENSNFIYEFSGKVPKLFVTLVNPSTTDTVSNLKVTFEITDKVNHEINITSHSDGDHVNNRVVSMTGTVPINDIEGGIDTIRVINNGATTITTVNADGSFEVGVVVGMDDNILKFQGFKGTQAVTKIKQLKLIGVENSAGGRNALIPSRVAVVLRWKTDGTDIDLYSTDKNDGTIWYNNMSVAPGILDYDNTSGYGPEVISYRETNDALYVDGNFDIDVHFYSGSTATAYSLDVILNETDSANVKARHYESKVSLPSGDSSQNAPTGSGTSRFNDVLSISCNAQRICSISAVDDNKLSSTSVTTQAIAFGTEQRNARLIDNRQKIFGTAYEQCMSEYNKSLEKIGSIDWYCDKKRGQRKLNK